MSRSFETLSSQILGAAVEVHRELGPGLLEVNYARALRVALEQRGVAYHAERPIALSFRGVGIGEFRLDLVVDDAIIVELKSVQRFEDIHFAQLRAYLRATGLQIGLLINFNAKVIAVRRMVHQLQG